MDELVLLTRMNSEPEAQIIKQKLAEADIECLMQSGDMDGVLPAIDYTMGVGIYVNADDFEEAQSLIGSDLDDLDDDAEIGVGD